MKRKPLYVVLAVGVALVVAPAAVVVRADRPVSAPYPPLHANTSPEGIARGEAIFHAMCESCHRAPDAERVSGARMEDVPAFLGTFYAANITSHPQAGVGAHTDEEIARIIRYGVSRDGRMTLMGSAMGDADVEAVLGFMRSGNPLFAPDDKAVPRSQVSFVGKLILTATGGTTPPERPAKGIAVPPRSDTLAYGRYLAHAVYDCAGCHSPGFSREKGEGPEAFSGGFEFVDRSGTQVVSTNLTFHATGLGGWSQEELAMAVRNGLSRGGGVVRYPMPRFRGIDDEEMGALYAYLKSVPALPAKVERTAAATP